MPSLPYEEPALQTWLVLAGFILILNFVNKVLDSFLHCGLIGQILVGVFFGTPGVRLLTREAEITVTGLGYLGLLQLVYYGGLSTSVSGLMSSSIISIPVATTGIILPIALSFLLIPLGASPLQCFSAGASLSATSLGTTFATIATTGLLNTHVGTVLTSAAMLDDVIGLIMLKIVMELGSGSGTTNDYGKTIARALGVSFGLVIFMVGICRLVLRPISEPLRAWAYSPKRNYVIKVKWDSPNTRLVVHTALFLALVVASNYTGASILLAAFMAGMIVRWWDDNITYIDEGVTVNHSQPAGYDTTLPSGPRPITGLQIYEQYYSSSAERILKPFFFASIGFSIPVTEMFHTSTIWKGFVYAILMFLGKIITGFWLVPGSFGSSTSLQVSHFIKRFRYKQGKAGDVSIVVPVKSPANIKETVPAEADWCPEGARISPPASSSPETTSPLADLSAGGEGVTRPESSAAIEAVENATVANSASAGKEDPKYFSASPPSQRALHAFAPALVGLAMTARGEIGFLIASVAESRGVFSSALTSAAGAPPAQDKRPNSELYLVVVWAITLCTIVGPVAVGALVRRIKWLEIQEGA